MDTELNITDDYQRVICDKNEQISFLKIQLSEAKALLKQFLEAKNIEETCVAENEAEQFLNSEVEK